MHGIRREDVYKTPEEEKAFANKLEKGFKLLDSFVASVRESDSTVSPSCGVLEDADEADRMFALSTAIIDFMPEFYPSWHYRKNYFLQPRLGEERLRALLADELSFSESVLKTSPKCYAVWQQRLWVLTLMFNMRCEDVGDILRKELSLCMMLFRLDGRNFHGWGHLNYVRHYLKLLESDSANVPPLPVDKLCYTEFSKLIEKNFSNYSAWFHRGMLSENCGCVSDDLDNLTPAIYTDPNDQCLWHHFDWLLYRRNALRYYLVRCCYFEESQSFVFFFNECVSLSTTDSFISVTSPDGNHAKLDGSWSAVSSSPRQSRLSSISVPEYAWRFTLTAPLSTNPSTCISPSLMVETDERTVESFYSHLRHLPKCNRTSDTRDVPNPPPCLLCLRYKLHLSESGELPIDLDSLEFMRSNMASCSGWEDLSGVLRAPVLLPGSSRIVSLGKDITPAILEQQLEMIDTLVGMGTESKYLHLARHKIRRHLGQPSDADECYQHVTRIDDIRARLHSDMLLVAKVQSALDASAAAGSTSASLSGMGIRRLPYRALSPHFTLEELDLSDNSLCEGSLIDIGICLLLRLHTISLARNGLKRLSSTLEVLRNLSRLRRLDLSGNPLDSMDQCTPIFVPESLMEIDISDTPLAAFLLDDTEQHGAATVVPRKYPILDGFEVHFDEPGSATSHRVPSSVSGAAPVAAVLKRASGRPR
ncbi:protein prenyltransferase alpha subunit repeat domain containing protein, putative [Babesia bigemina]|uniref:Geranylgeranyl transferase type-2 subunit alpha n=1 Tax=Babesia bigemina TaxID=5866 RepID=A0A061DDI2_BABBI|nr:protein prenyltransferase alpha subunit repeat domain containing protein, putative [Babesia bigemina]CDR97429.1 protein prenyltransferase alpha subunit repeat domain containing protein, putative [Babesia bigemina]|eukprot:XP_012769615.1 protein prenyltransferase alpha subunit repeat domain containing protein, putative [Babesia bigemina]